MHSVDQHHVDNWIVCPRGAAINPVVGSHCLQVNVLKRRTERGADGFHCSSLINKGERNSHFFSRAISTASLRISFSMVFLPSRR